MSYAPKQNWSLYEKLCQAEHTRWFRSMTVQESWMLYCSMFDLGQQMAHNSPPDPAAEQRRWEEKLKLRQRMVKAFSRLDEWRRDKQPQRSPG